jgi:hypothetical protein
MASAVSTARSSPSARDLARLRGQSFGLLVMLIVQFAIGIVVNLYVTVPAGDKGGFFGALGKALSDGPAALASHAGLGLLIVLAALALIVRAIIIRHAPTIVLSVLGLLSILGAAASGIRFVADGGSDNASLAMGLATAGAMLWYAISLFVLGNMRPSAAGQPGVTGERRPGSRGSLT